MLERVWWSTPRRCSPWQGNPPKQAADSAQTVLRIETALAKASMDRTARRDPKVRDHKMTREEAVSLAPKFYLDRYFAAMGTPSFSSLNVTNPDFFKQVNTVLDTESAGCFPDLRDLAFTGRRRSLAFSALR